MRAAASTFLQYSFFSQTLLLSYSATHTCTHALLRSPPFIARRFAVSFRPPPPRIPRSTASKMAQDADVFVGAIDQGTTSSRFLIFNKEGEPVAEHQEVCTLHGSLPIRTFAVASAQCLEERANIYDRSSHRSSPTQDGMSTTPKSSSHL